VKPELSIIIPTRERASYLRHSIATCLDNPGAAFEVVVLDNASTDDTPGVVRAIKDDRVRYERSEERLSMRANFERGVEVARGSVLCFIGDDDGIFPDTVARALRIFAAHPVKALSAARAHYFWPDLLAGRRNTALLPRSDGVAMLDSRQELRHLLVDNDYYRLPCLYHGFVHRELVERIRQRNGRFFLSSQVDIYSTIALSMEGVPYALSRAPLVINGGSRRSNGASHFGGGDKRERELWKAEDDTRFLSGFEQSASVGNLIIESALRYGAAHGDLPLDAMFDIADCARAFGHEQALRRKQGRPVEELEPAYRLAGVRPSDAPGSAAPLRRIRTLASAFMRSCPVDMGRAGVEDVHAASRVLSVMLSSGRQRLSSRPWQQLATALRIARR